jgi:predicted nucleic acid-binding protein
LTVVLDASVAVKWFVREDPAADRAAEQQLARIVDGEDEAAVPELFFFEVLAVLVRRLPSAPDVALAMDALARLGLRRFALDKEIAEHAAGLSISHGLTGYDAAYVALASSLGATWVTFDAEAHHRIEALGVSALLG